MYTISVVLMLFQPAPKKVACTKSMRQLLETLAEIKDPSPDTTSPPINERPIRPVKNTSTSPRARTPPSVPRIIRKVCAKKLSLAIHRSKKDGDMSILPECIAGIR